MVCLCVCLWVRVCAGYTSQFEGETGSGIDPQAETGYGRRTSTWQCAKIG